MQDHLLLHRVHVREFLLYLRILRNKEDVISLPPIGHGHEVLGVDFAHAKGVVFPAEGVDDEMFQRSERCTDSFRLHTNIMYTVRPRYSLAQSILGLFPGFVTVRMKNPPMPSTSILLAGIMGFFIIGYAMKPTLKHVQDHVPDRKIQFHSLLDIINHRDSGVGLNFLGFVKYLTPWWSSMGHGDIRKAGNPAEDSFSGSSTLQTIMCNLFLRKTSGSEKGTLSSPLSMNPAR